jgi:spermidine synthase
MPQIYTSYNMCADCGARLHNYGTPEILRDYGFVEQYPQRWYFHSHPISFDIVPLFKTDENGQEVETGETQVKWTRSPSDEGLQFLRDQLRRLRRLQQSKLHEWIPGVPEQEWDVITKFVSAMVMAFSDALKSVEALDREESTSCGPDENCTVLDRYNQFLASDEPETWGDSRPETCDTKRIYKFDDWETLEEIQSPYQQLAYAWVPVSDDLCFDLDDTVQICASYRPHYHEMMVHYAARFLKSVKRVLFVGGGDSMLLHEALKYKELELVVGLELDQVVPRNSFRYFGTQPHFDDPRVEWWFGDATKSLTMLPSGYFGSFDLVLVDLSETVQALSVTDELNVLEALLLLVKHDGVLVQNEYMHFLEQASIFKHSLHVHYDSVPIVCSQSLILASNGIDFVRGPLYNHSVNTLYALLDAENVRHRILRDYQLNQTNPHFCNKLSNLSDAHQVAAEQVQSPGILIVLEAENTKLLIAPALRDSLVMAMRKIFGIEVLGATIADEGEGRAVITILLRNGYIVARIWPNRRYCAFDIHFWSKFHLQDPVRASIVEALGSGDRSKVSTSVYRIVASGMFGSDSWRDDDARRGPQLAELCPFPVPPMASNATAELHSSALTALIHDSADLIQGNGHDVLVLCARNVDECTSATVLKEVSGIAKVLLLHPCKDLKDDEYDQDGLERMLRCEKSILDQLMKSQSTAIRAIVLDSSSPHSLAKIVARIFSSPLNVKRWLDDKVLVGATVLDGSAWRKSFAEYFRKEVYETDPVFTADLSVTGTGNSFDFIVTSAGDEAFPRRLMDFTQKLEEKRDIVLQVQRIRSGLFSFQYDFQPDQVSFEDTSPLCRGILADDTSFALLRSFHTVTMIRAQLSNNGTRSFRLGFKRFFSLRQKTDREHRCRQKSWRLSFEKLFSL